MPKLIPIAGGCHCGNINYILMWPESEAEIAIRECGCTFCRKHGGIWTSNRSAKLVAQLSDNNSVSKYRFGTATADFFICSRCGVVPFVISDVDGHDYAVVNANTFKDTGQLPVSKILTNFDGEETADRLNRRKRNWIKRVEITVSQGC